MNDFPRQTLRQILAKYGKEIAGNDQRCKGLLNDLCGSYRREINILVTAIEERIPLDLLASARSISAELVLTRLEKRLADQTGLTAEAARWAVESWALALDVATDSQIAERGLKQNDYPTDKFQKSRASGDKNQSLLEIKIAPHEPPSKTQTNQPPTRTAPPTNKPPTKMPLPSSAPVPAVPANNEPPIQSSGTNYPSTTNQTVGSNRRSRFFRGCLIFLFILIVSGILLVFVAPYALEQMRETQRERQNEPPRFPVR